MQARHLRFAFLAAAGLMALGQSAWAGQPYYKVSIPPLSVVPGGLSYAGAINNRGTTAIQSVAPNNYEDAYRCSTTVCKQIPRFPDNQFHDPVLASGINDSGQVVGTASNHDLRRAFLFDGRTVKDLGVFGEGCRDCVLVSYGAGINNVGQVVGTGSTADQTERAFIWQNGQMTKLGTLGGANSYGRAINDNGKVVGESVNHKGETHAFSYSAGKMIDLGTLGGSFSFAYGVNKWGHVVGCSGTAGDAARVSYVIYSGGVMQPLKSLGVTNACAQGINQAGWIVGFSNLTPGQPDYHGFVYDGDQVYDLNDTLADDDQAAWEIISASGINKNGQIIVSAKSRLAQDMYRALVLTPVVR
jgi:probable HAF family extracellular repeat protein